MLTESAFVGSGWDNESFPGARYLNANTIPRGFKKKRKSSGSSVTSSGPPSPLDHITANPQIDSFEYLSYSAYTPKALPTPVGGPTSNSSMTSQYHHTSVQDATGYSPNMRRLLTSAPDEDVSYTFSAPQLVSSMSFETPATPHTNYEVDYDDQKNLYPGYPSAAFIQAMQDVSTDTSLRGFLELFPQTGSREPLFHSLDTIWSIAFNALSWNARGLLDVLALLSPDSNLIDLFLPNDQERLTKKLAFCRTGEGELVSRPAIQTQNKDLPIAIKGKRLNACADTGSDECGMPKNVAAHLGLKVCCGPSDIREFEIGNGRKIKSIGRTTVDCSFWNEPGRKLRCDFYVFERLVVPLIMGRKFLESTDTLTQHQYRLVDRPPRTGLCRVMHLTRPKRRMRCYINSELVEANPDTGAEMELVSPDFIRRKGYAIDTPDPEHQEVQFADGSIAQTQGQVTMIFEAYGDASKDTVPTKARYRKFYVLDGLTTDVLLGEDLLYGINAFTEHETSFVDREGIDRSVELKGIVWLDRAEQRLARIFGGDFSSISAALPETGMDSDPRSRMNRFTSLIGRATGARTQGEAHRAAQRELDFEREMDNRDARENARQEAADLRIDRLPIHQRVTALEQEERIRQAFDDDQRQRRQQHEAALAATVHQVPVASIACASGAGTRP